MVKLGRNRIVYKKVYIREKNQVRTVRDRCDIIATLRIPKGAWVRESIDRVGNISILHLRKNRASKAKVLKLEQNNKLINKAHSGYNQRFIYQVGRIVVPKRAFNTRDIHCASGIHFFKHRQDAKNY